MSGAGDPAPRGAGSRRPPGPPLPVAFYGRDTLEVARDLLGCLLCRREEDGTWTWGRIVETEAYVGEEDPACHAAAGLTPRTRVLYGPPGRSYVYFTYGMHHLLNAVTERNGFPAAVLIRALRPLAGIDRMVARRGTTEPARLASGPSRLCEALGLDLRWNDVPLYRGNLRIAPADIPRVAAARGGRIGIRRGADRPWRFWIPGDPFVSRVREGAPRSRRAGVHD